MKAYKKQFIEFVIEKKALQFGSFQLKSGRISPYFFNSGIFNTGTDLSKLGQFYAQAIMDSGVQGDILFGPAYKGIPLVCATSIAFYEHHQETIPYCFNRKETKDHGEGGQIVGGELQGDIILVDDVITAGTAIKESITLIGQHQANLKAIFVSIDRQEKGQGSLSAIQEIEQNFGTCVFSIINITDILNYLEQDLAFQEVCQEIRVYKETYGV